ncbi:protein TolR [Pseudoteredinibacter isoporae]|uniref:Tol-Pal system protein TolR n=1 Tax=Pseudoteredinibacter isoporae TaxID=570281 RepID=A0A7X0JV77_9GAMM|nr:protein TolR [Pseudoteredinibacter isoporae]MBB6522894.1 biopolymer transport protein TolR [Pseudoteredinibacter isoporae]NHO88420.1 protein TolR [Pseudoteredinibacter isoporae]NIB23249.1 protein TolR [Pseudoteredinibacter isoporae]
MSWKRRVKKKPMAEINVVPYIDVMLVLLVVFMVTAPLLMQGVKVDLPQAPSAPLDEKQDEPLIVSVDKAGLYYLNLGKDEKVAKPIAEITDTVAKVLRQKPTTPVLVWGDHSVDYGLVVGLMTQLQAAGAPSVGLVTEAPRESNAR